MALAPRPPAPVHELYMGSDYGKQSRFICCLILNGKSQLGILDLVCDRNPAFIIAEQFLWSRQCRRRGQKQT